MILRKKIKSMARKLKSYMAFNCKSIRDSNDPLTFMTKLKKYVTDLLDDTEAFMSSLHQKNPFQSTTQPLRRFSTSEKFYSSDLISKKENIKNFNYISHRSSQQKPQETKKTISPIYDGYLKDTFVSKYQRHINEIQKLTHLSRDSKFTKNILITNNIGRLQIIFQAEKMPLRIKQITKPYIKV